MRCFLCGLVCGFLFLSSGIQAQEYRQPEWVLDEGGQEATSASYILNGSFHQTTIGYTTGGNYIGWIGFWHPRPRLTLAHDVAAVRIVSPSGVVDTLSEITPRATVVNYGNVAENFLAIFSIRMQGGGISVYRNVKLVHLEPGESRVESFTPTLLHSTGPHIARCSVALASDTNRANDTVSLVFKVLSRPPLPEGWSEVDPVPAPPSGRGVQAGGWLAVDPSAGVLYVSKGNKSADFYCYNPSATPAWRSLADWPKGREGKLPARGSRGCAPGNGYVYATKGNNTLGFWRYDVYFDAWEQLPDVPYPPSTRRVKDGCDLTAVELDGVIYIYLLKGQRGDFYRYNTLTGVWEELPSAPGVTKWYRGSFIVYDGAGTIYAHKGKYHEFYAYDVRAGEWRPDPLTPMPISSPKMLTSKRSKDGGCGTWGYNSILALKGGNTCEFWRYHPDGDSWTELDTMPSVGSSGRKKRVRDGGDIDLFVDGLVYALKGNKTLEMWRYVPGAEIVHPEPKLRSGVMAEETRPCGPFLEPAAPAHRDNLAVRYYLGCEQTARVELLDISGRTVARENVTGPEGCFKPHGNTLRSGIYFVRLITRGATLFRKVVILP